MPYLVAIGGHIGTGKTTLAYGLKRAVPALADAAIIDNDRVRRQMLGFPLNAMVPEEFYVPAVSEQVDRLIEAETAASLKSGQSVINPSGFFVLENDIQNIEDTANRCGAKFIGIWLHAPRHIMEQRITTRLTHKQTGQNLTAEDGHESDAKIETIDKFGLIKKPSCSAWKHYNASVSREDLLKSVIENNFIPS